jgi:uncharacterized protein YwgA
MTPKLTSVGLIYVMGGRYQNIALEFVVEIGLNHHRSFLQKLIYIVAFIQSFHEKVVWSFFTHFGHVAG